MNIADLAKLTGQQIPVTGILNANINIHGSELNPVGDGNLSLTHMIAYEEPVNSVKLKFSGTGEEAQGDLAIQLPAGDIQSNVSIRPKQRTYTAQLTSSGIRLDKLQALKAKNIDAVGMLALNAKGQGSFDNPQLNADCSDSLAHYSKSEDYRNQSSNERRRTRRGRNIVLVRG